MEKEELVLCFLGVSRGVGEGAGQGGNNDRAYWDAIELWNNVMG